MTNDDILIKVYVDYLPLWKNEYILKTSDLRFIDGGLFWIEDRTSGAWDDYARREKKIMENSLAFHRMGIALYDSSRTMIVTHNI